MYKQQIQLLRENLRYEVSYTAVSRGLEKVVNGRGTCGSPFLHILRMREYAYPFTMTVSRDPRLLRYPVATVTGLQIPSGIAINSRGEMIVTEIAGDQVSIFDIRKKRIKSFGSCGDSSEQMVRPAGIAIDVMDNIYVSSENKLQKFTSSGGLMNYVGQEGSEEGEFRRPHGVTVYNNQVYVCDTGNNRIQVFDLDLKIRSFCSSGKEKLHAPYDIKFDTAGYMYIVEHEMRVQVLDSSGNFMRVFGEGRGSSPSGLCIMDDYVYVTNRDFKFFYSWCGTICVKQGIFVYTTSGQFVTFLGNTGRREGKFLRPCCITTCANGFIYVCDGGNERIQIF